VPGDIIETGVWRGDASIMARAVLIAHDISDRKVIVADSLEGLPPPAADLYPADHDSTLHEFQELAISLEQVRENFRKFDLLDEQAVHDFLDAREITPQIQPIDGAGVYFQKPAWSVHPSRPPSVSARKQRGLSFAQPNRRTPEIASGAEPTRRMLD
jgi:hypothetical protein